MNSQKVLRNQIRNERGDALMLAIVMAAISMISSLVMMNYTNQVEAGSKRPRVKSMMAATEAKVRELLLSPASYTGCTTGVVGTVGTGRQNCNLDTAKVEALSRTIPDAACPTQNPCGIRVTRTSFQPEITVGTEIVSRAEVNIKYEGTDISLREIDVSMDIPADILQSTGLYQCPDTAPKFLGFKPNGQMECAPVPGVAAPGQFLNAIDMNNLTTSSFTLPGIQTCPSTDFVSYVNWGTGGTAFSKTCSPRTDPFVTFGFNPASGVNDINYVTNTD